MLGVTAIVEKLGKLAVEYDKQERYAEDTVLIMRARAILEGVRHCPTLPYEMSETALRIGWSEDMGK